MIVGQILEMWRRFKVFCGFSAELYPDQDAESVVVPPVERLRALLKRPALRLILALVLTVEGGVLAAWLWSDHREHLQSAWAYVTHLGQRTSEPTICTAPRAVARDTSSTSHPPQTLLLSPSSPASGSPDRALPTLSQ
jgi:hypothetical protein